ncbi:hypothetical protein ACQKCU_11720 [Heyndrickxia sporothermodurans]
MSILTEEQIINYLQQLRSGEIKELFVENNDFYEFRKILVEQKDFKHFQGIAQRNGHVLYSYLDEARS